jgi:hypothetical protein
MGRAQRSVQPQGEIGLARGLNENVVLKAMPPPLRSVMPQLLAVGHLTGRITLTRITSQPIFCPSIRMAS